jgi:hypothetical protein
VKQLDAHEPGTETPLTGNLASSADARAIYERASLTVIEGDVEITTGTGDIVSSGCGLLVGLGHALLLERQLTDG